MTPVSAPARSVIVSEIRRKRAFTSMVEGPQNGCFSSVRTCRDAARADDVIEESCAP
jgi:hypothetical protein